MLWFARILMRMGCVQESPVFSVRFLDSRGCLPYSRPLIIL